MDEFATVSGNIKASMDNIQESVQTVNIAIEESALGVTNVTQMAVDLNTSVSDIGEEANTNMGISDKLNVEVGRFRV